MAGRPGKRFIAIDPDGNEHEEVNLAKFCRDHGLDAREARRVKGTNNVHRGWRFKDIPTEREKFEKVASQSDITAELGAIEQMIDGEIEMNPRKLVAECSKATLRMTIGLSQGIAPNAQWNPANINRAMELYAKASGFSLEHALDQRSDAERYQDGVATLVRNTRAIFELDDELTAMEAQLAQIDEKGDEYMTQLESAFENMRADEILPADKLPEGQDPGEPPGPKTIAAAARVWIDRIRRVQHLAHRAKHASDPGMNRREKMISEGTHSLRYQLYVNRSGVTFRHPAIDNRKSNVFKFGLVHVRASMGLYLAEQKAGVGIAPGRVLLPDDTYTFEGRQCVFEGVDYSGKIMRMPPRHGKTAWICAVFGLKIGIDPRIQMAYVHDQADAAKVFKAALGNMFDMDEEQGRRNYRLFPYELADNQNNASMLRVKVSNPPSNPNVIASGLRASYQGLTLQFLAGDDLVPTKDLDHPTDRKRRHTIWNGTWVSRLTGEDAFLLLSGYPRHHEDLMESKYQEALRSARSGYRDGDPMWVMNAPVGGPHTKPPFFSVCPELYGPKWLKKQYLRMSDPATWAANWMQVPMTEDMQIVQRLRLLDMDDDDVMRLMDPENSENQVSVDPSAKGDGIGDRAGLVVGTIGDLVHVEENAHGTKTSRETLLVIRSAKEFDATQLELMDQIMSVARLMSVSIAHIETVTGLGSAIIEPLQRYHNVHSTNEIPVSSNKRQRFKAVAGMIEDADPFITAKVCFLGRRPKDEQGNPIPNAPLEIAHELYGKLPDYILHFAVESGYHSLDAFTQLLAENMHRVGLGTGALSREVRKQDEGRQINERKARYYEAVKKKQRMKSHGASRRRYTMQSAPV